MALRGSAFAILTATLVTVAGAASAWAQAQEARTGSEPERSGELSEPEGAEPGEPAQGAPAGGLDVELLPELSFHLMGGRYEPSEEDTRWTTWIGAGVGVARIGTATFYSTADVETIMGSERRAFDARQANYHLQVGVRRPIAAWQMELYFDHVSRHEVDREKGPAVDWNAVGVRGSRTLDEQLGIPLRISLSASHTTLASQVDYRFQLAAAVESDVVRWDGGLAFLRGRLRAVTVGDDPELARGSFIDASLEGGVRVQRGRQSFELFVAFDHRNDVRQLEAGLRNRALFGIRLFGGSAPLVGSHLSGLGPRTEVETAPRPAQLASTEPGPPETAPPSDPAAATHP